MSLSQTAKAEIVKNIQQKTTLAANDTGSVEIQVALLSQRITELTEHFKTHKNDEHSRYGLRKLVNKRRSLLNYLKKNDLKRYQALIEILNLRH
jgi:small subunit ribosomal protein S15